MYGSASVDAVGESSNSTPVAVTACTPPTAPQGLAASVGGPQIGLSWNSTPAATSYSVARSTSASPYTYVATGLTSPGFTDTNVASGVIYFYIRAAANACNQGPFSSAVAAALPPPPPTGLTAAPGNGHVLLDWNAPSPPTGFNVKRSTTNGGPYAIIAGNLTGTSWLDTGLVNGGTYYYVLSALLPGSESPNSAPVAATPCGLPAGWADQDIGSVGYAGSASGCANAFTLQGGGADIWGSADAFNLLSTSLTGTNTLIIRVVAVQNTDGWAKAGLMFRNDTTAGSMFADLFVSPANGVNLQWRATTGGQCGSLGVTGVVAPLWL